jgi:hypothetical protein
MEQPLKLAFHINLCNQRISKLLYIHCFSIQTIEKHTLFVTSQNNPSKKPVVGGSSASFFGIANKKTGNHYVAGYLTVQIKQYV